jgi:hypothetical protein
MSNLDLIETDCGDNSCHIGTTFSTDIYFTQSCSRDGLPVDLSGYSAEMIVVDSLTSDEIVTITGVIDTPEDGLINFTLTPTQTDNLEVGIYKYYVNLLIDSNIYRVLQGSFEVKI